MSRLDEIKRLAQSGDFAQAQELYRSFMNEMFHWDEKDQLFRRKDAPQQITLSKDQYDDFINHHFKEWCGSQKRSLMKETANQSSIVVLNEGKTIDVKSDRKSLRKSQSKHQKDEDDDEHFLSDNEEDEHESLVVPLKKSASRRKELSRARDDVPTMKSSQMKQQESSSHKVQNSSVQKIVENVNVKQSESKVVPLSNTRHSSIKTPDETTITSARKSAAKSERPSSHKNEVSRSRLTSAAKDFVNNQNDQSSHAEEITRPSSSIKQSASKESARKQSAVRESSIKLSEEPLASAKKIAQPSQIKDTDQSSIREIKEISQIKQTVNDEQHPEIVQEPIAEQTLSEPTKPSSAVKQTNVEPHFEPASYVKKVYEEDVKTIPASSQKINKTQRPDKSVLIAYQSLIYPPIEVTRPVFDSYKQSNSELLFTDPITGYPFIILRDKKANSVCRVFATGDALTMQQNSFGLKNLYESRFLMRNFIRDISTIRTLSSTLSVSAQKLN